MSERDLFVRARHLAKGEERCRARARRAEDLLTKFTRIGGSHRFPTTCDMLRGEWQKFMTLAHRCHTRRREVLGGAE